MRAPNDVKRIVTKSGHRITIVDKPGKNSIVVATPKHLKISLIENSDETGDAVLTLHSDGDILFSAPNGRIHAHSKLFSREVGDAGTLSRAAGTATTLLAQSSTLLRDANQQATRPKKPGCGRSADDYKKQAEEQIAKAGNNPLDRNKAITRAYADIYKSDPATYKWSGMAAFASCEVGEGMKEARDAESSWWKNPAGKMVAGVNPMKLRHALVTGNNAVYADIYWQHLAYQSCGIEEMEKAYNDGKINDKVITAWREIDAGKVAGDRGMIWDGNRKLLEYEQRTVLQNAVYDPDRQLWKNLSSPPASWYQKIDSPIPGDKANFEAYSKGGDIGNPDDRWKWISQSMLPAWQKLDQNPVDAANKLEPCVK